MGEFFCLLVFYCEVSHTLEWIAQRGSAFSTLWRYSKPNWMLSWAICSSWPCLSQELRLHDCKKSFPTSTIWWLHDLFSSVLRCWVAYLRNHLLVYCRCLFYFTVTYLIINVVWPQAANNHADECFAYGYPAEVALRVVWRSFSSRLAPRFVIVPLTEMLSPSPCAWTLAAVLPLLVSLRARVRQGVLQASSRAHLVFLLRISSA